MASLQPRRVRGHTYWHIVESRRVNGKPRPVPIAYLGKADDLLARLRGAEALRLHSHSHGAVAALHSLAVELDVAGTINRHLATAGRRDRRQPVYVPDPGRVPVDNDGLSVGQSLALVAVGRACHATSKRAFAEWAQTTTLGELAGVDVRRLTSQHFWDQMDQLPVELIAPIECEIVGRALTGFTPPLNTLLYDATNFFTFIASTNTKPKLPARGHQKQKRNDLRQIGVALLCSRRDGIPLWHVTYGGQVADSKCFAAVLPAIRERLAQLGRAPDTLTIVYDKGNVSRANQQLVDAAPFHYVSALPTAGQRTLVAHANAHLADVVLGPDETGPAFRTRRTLWGGDRTVIVIVSERLREGQMRGIMQHVAAAQRWLARLADTLKRGKQRRDRARIERDIESRLHGRQCLSRVLRFQLSGADPTLTLTYQFDAQAFGKLAQDQLGRVVMITDHHDWPTADIIHAYRAQADVEALFAHLKDPLHVALRPQRHWTDQKLHVHVFTCVLGYLLLRLLHLRARKAGADYDSPERLIDALERVRRVTVARSLTGKGRLRLSTQLEEVEPQFAPLLSVLRIPA